MYIQSLSPSRVDTKKRQQAFALTFLALLAILLFGFKEALADPSLSSTLTVKKTTVKETATLKVTMSVTNTGTVILPGVRPSQLQTTGLGKAMRQAWPKPAVAVIAPGETVNFSLSYKAMLAGEIVMSGNAMSPLANSSVTSTPPIMITSKKKTKGASLTDYEGNVPVKVGSATVKLHFADETTGSSISGLSVAAAVDKKNPSRAVVVAVDGHGRYPIQILVLQGPSSASLSKQVSHQIVADQLATMEVPLRSGCDVDAEALGWTVRPPVETTVLPPLPPPSTPGVPDDFSSPLTSAITAGLSSAWQAAQKAVISTVAVSCNEALNFDTEAIVGAPLETLLSFPADKALEAVAPKIGSFVSIYGDVQGLLSKLNLARDLLRCGLFPDDELTLKRVTFLPFSEKFQLVWHQPLSPEPDPSPLPSIAASATDPSGQPVTSGSLELLSKVDFGRGFVEALDSLGTGEIAVPLGDYSWIVRSPGFKPSCGEASVTESGGSIATTMQQNYIASGSLKAGQLTGFLPAGTVFNVTPTFLDANGTQVACNGQVFYQVNNPVGSVVATVDQSGNVTMGADCGAARVTAWCSGVQTSGVLVSTDCNGTLPGAPPSTFAVSPPSLDFTATEGGANPPSQILAIVQLSTDAPHAYGIVPNAAWVSVLSPNPAGAYPVSVNISGMKAGTYKTTIDVTDLNVPTNHQSVTVTLKIQPAQNGGGGDISGTWVGTWTWPTNYTFGPYVCNNLQNKTESGTMTMTLSTTAGTLPYIASVSGTVNMSGFEAASIPCGGGEICNSCSWVPFNVTSAPIDSALSIWGSITNQALIFADVDVPPMEPPLYISYPFSGLTFNGTYANGKITGIFNDTGTFSVTKQ
jgi:hypothetical protein